MSFLRKISTRSCSSLREARSCQDYLSVCQNSTISLSSLAFRGTFYEFQAKEAMETHLHLTDLVRVGGAGDNGVDLFGKWDFARLCNLKQLPQGQHPVNALVQCKNYASKIKPNVVRELAGAYEYHTNRTRSTTVPTFMFLVSPLGLTKLAQTQMDISFVPIVHVRISPMTREISGEGNEDFLVQNWGSYTFGPVYMNEMAKTVAKDVIKHHNESGNGLNPLYKKIGRQIIVN
ncbi:hypothetical protein PUMCH_001018 [Australozyma saopauloensis]|uniref:Required for respiratory growth protein 7, mitochondrial n=1 Tax=Australozyma saopauloensis TaxID=291208 RepID=A0AAX4H736_9ASCO|nr:hypothetical protein PUMCH_001018 [[Candida] saopauloensis]